MRRRGLAALAAGMALAGTASAHHAFNMYDNSKYTPLTGTVKSYSWKNPHVMIDFVAIDAKGQADPWSVECSSPNIIGRHGWTSSSLKPGDKVDIVVHPMKDGSHIALMVKVTTPSGEVLKDKM
jgi:uncharacterized cupredoxin-like copper-binding protein